MLVLSSETESLVRSAAVISGKTPDQLIREAFSGPAQPANFLPPRQAKAIDMARVDAITRQCASRPVLDIRSAADILEEAWGLPG